MYMNAEQSIQADSSTISNISASDKQTAINKQIKLTQRSQRKQTLPSVLSPVKLEKKLALYLVLAHSLDYVKT